MCSIIFLSTVAVAQSWLVDTMTVFLMGCSGLAGGTLACCTLAALKHPITLLLSLRPDVLHEATPYWWIRVAITPLVLLNMTISGILQVHFCKCFAFDCCSIAVAVHQIYQYSHDCASKDPAFLAALELNLMQSAPLDSILSQFPCCLSNSLCVVSPSLWCLCVSVPLKLACAKPWWSQSLWLYHHTI